MMLEKEERIASLNEGQLPVMEHFYTIQGEGAHSGTPAYFIRIGGCDVGCHWCDVKESWNFEKHPAMDVEQIVELASQSGASIAVITGGEPLIYNMDLLTTLLRERGIRTHLETSGAYPLTGRWNWVTLSPKKFKAPVKGFHASADELKVVVFHASDLDFARQHAENTNDDCTLFLQPEWDRKDKMTPIIIDFVKQHPQWRISIQSHKFMQIP